MCLVGGGFVPVCSVMVMVLCKCSMMVVVVYVLHANREGGLKNGKT